MSSCHTYSRPVIKAFDPLQKIIYLFQPRCKMWSCLPCAHTNKLLWQAKISHGYEFYSAAGLAEWRFVTLTSHFKLTTEAQCLYVFKSAWQKLSARIRRKFPGIRYVLLPEHHKDGRVHWHMICSHGLSSRWLKDKAPLTGLGYMTDCEPIDDNLAAIFYVAKYLGKSIADEQWPQKLKRIRTTQKWPLLPPENDDYENLDVTWRFWLKYPSEGLDYLAYELERDTGYLVKVLNKPEKPIDIYADND